MSLQIKKGPIHAQAAPSLSLIQKISITQAMDGPALQNLHVPIMSII